MSHQHDNVRKIKILRLNGGDRYQQTFDSCLDCTLQTNVRLTELKKGNHRGNNN